MKNNKHDLRSKEWFGSNDKMGFVHRSWLRNRYPDDMFRGKPVIGICNTWSEPILYITSSEKIVGYIVENDMSSRSIEGENPLYLPQAKNYDRSAAIGTCIFVTEVPFPQESKIYLNIVREGAKVFEGKIGVDQIVRNFEDIVAYLYQHTTFPDGSFLMTGTGIVPEASFTLMKGDEINIIIDHIGTLTNTIG